MCPLTRPMLARDSALTSLTAGRSRLSLDSPRVDQGTPHVAPEVVVIVTILIEEPQATPMTVSTHVTCILSPGHLGLVHHLQPHALPGYFMLSTICNDIRTQACWGRSSLPLSVCPLGRR